MESPQGTESKKPFQRSLKPGRILIYVRRDKNENSRPSVTVSVRNLTRVLVCSDRLTRT